MPVVDHLRVLDGSHQAPEHDGQIRYFLTVVVAHHRHVRDHHVGQHLDREWVQDICCSGQCKESHKWNSRAKCRGEHASAVPRKLTEESGWIVHRVHTV